MGGHQYRNYSPKAPNQMASQSVLLNILKQLLNFRVTRFITYQERTKCVRIKSFYFTETEKDAMSEAVQMYQQLQSHRSIICELGLTYCIFRACLCKSDMGFVSREGKSHKNRDFQRVLLHRTTKISLLRKQDFHFHRKHPTQMCP